MSTPLQLNLVTFTKGAYITVEGKQSSGRFYIIREGKVVVNKEIEMVKEEEGNVFSPGDFFAVVSTMSGHSHIETARALTDCVLIEVLRNNYEALIVNNTPVAMKIIQKFSQRMRYLDEALSRATQKEVVEPSLEHLFTVGEYYVKKSMFSQAHYAYSQYIHLRPTGKNVQRARERVEKIGAYSKAVYIDGGETEFTRTYPKGTMIFSEAMPGRELYIIQRGAVRITKIVNNSEVLLAVLKSGDIFGEMSLIEEKPRSASAIADEETQLLAVNKENFARMVTTQPQIIARLTQLLSERIWFVYKQLANITLTNPVGRLYDALLIQLERNREPIRPNEPYAFDFTTGDLISMAALEPAEGNHALREILRNPRFKVLDNRIYATDKEEIQKQASYFRKMQRIERSRATKRHA